MLRLFLVAYVVDLFFFKLALQGIEVNRKAKPLKVLSKFKNVKQIGGYKQIWRWCTNRVIDLVTYNLVTIKSYNYIIKLKYLAILFIL